MAKTSVRAAIKAGVKIPIGCYVLAEKAAALGAKVYLLDERKRVRRLPVLYVVESKTPLELPATCEEMLVVPVVDGNYLSVSEDRNQTSAHGEAALVRWGDRRVDGHGLAAPSLWVTMYDRRRPAAPGAWAFGLGVNELYASQFRAPLEFPPPTASRADVQGVYDGVDGSVRYEGALADPRSFKTYYESRFRGTWSLEDGLNLVRYLGDRLSGRARQNPRRRR